MDPIYTTGLRFYRRVDFLCEADRTVKHPFLPCIQQVFNLGMYQYFYDTVKIRVWLTMVNRSAMVGSGSGSRSS